MKDGEPARAVNATDVCAVVVTYHPDSEFPERLARILPQVGALVIVDNGSSKAELEMLREISANPSITLVPNAENLGVARALNIGIQRAALKSSWALLLDQDSLVDDDMVQRLLALYAAFPDKDQVAVIGSGFRNLNEGYHAPDIEIHREAAAAGNARPEAWKEVESVITSGSLVPLKAHAAIGPFREEFFIDYVDTDYCFRARAQGLRVIKTRKPIMSHAIGAATQHGLLWMNKWTTNHSPDRRYYGARNDTVMLREYGNYPFGSWALKSLARRLRTCKRIALYEEMKSVKIIAVMHGWWDGVRGHMGPRAPTKGPSAGGRMMRVHGALLLALVLAPAALSAAAALPPSPPAYGVQIINTWIPMHDGVRLAVTLYMPAGGKARERFPALLEYLPYRKDDDEVMRDFANHSYFARRGFVGARVDIRGFGNSEGAPPEREYSAQEQQDAEQVIAWLAHQSWSNGRVGMLGISWGGFNAIQMALRKPPALKAILAVAATEELFKEDVHYMDGVFHVDEFELTMDLDQGRSGAPDFSLEESVIGPRMDSTPWSLTYMRHQRDGAFWRAPLRPIDELAIPAFLIGGLQDGYRDSIPRMLEKAKAPLKAWIGPWNHGFPNGSDYGPLYEWRDQAVRWFDYWLKGRDTGVLEDPRVVVYQQHWHPPGSQSQDIPGEWRAEQWPPAGLTPTTLYLQPDHRLSAGESAPGRDELRCVPSTGVEAGFWWGELLGDQRSVDAYSLIYESQTLSEPLAILGLPQVSLQVASDAPLANWFVRLSDVAPDGRVTLVTGAGINGAQRNSMAEPEDLTPGKIYRLSFNLHLASWVFPKGHRIRIAVSNALWPMNWPTPYPLTTSLMMGGDDASRLILPRVPVHGPAAPVFAPPEPVDEPVGITEIGGSDGAWPGQWTVLRDQAHEHSTVVWQGKVAMAYPWGRFDHSERLTYDIDDAHPDVARVQGDSEYIQRVKDHTLTWRGRLDVSSDAHTFFYKYTRTLLRDGTIIRTKSWDEPIPRDHQ